MNQNVKLITEYPLREALSIYFGMWKRLFLVSIKSVVALGIIVVVGQLIGSLILGAVLRLLSSSFWGTVNFLLEHRIAVGGAIALLAVILIALRTARTTNPTKW